jgi:acetylornithine/succinyldiaminopimelate/putrescine aminotransferase
MMGLKFPEADAGVVAAKRLVDAGVFAVYAANDTSVVQLLPPLVITDEELGEVLETVRRLWS